MAHTFDTSGSVVGSALASITLSYTTGAGATAMVLSVCVSGTTARTGGAPTYNGVPFIQVGTTQATGGTASQHEMWVLTYGLTQGTTANIVVPNTGTRTITIIASTYAAASGLATTCSTTAQASGNTTNPTVSLTLTQAGNALVSGVCGSVGTPTAGTGRTLITAGTSTIAYGAEYLLQTGSGTAAMNYTATTGRWATHAVILVEVPQNARSMMMGFGA